MSEAILTPPLTPEAPSRLDLTGLASNPDVQTAAHGFEYRDYTDVTITPGYLRREALTDVDHFAAANIVLDEAADPLTPGRPDQAERVQKLQDALDGPVLHVEAPVERVPLDPGRTKAVDDALGAVVKAGEFYEAGAPPVRPAGAAPAADLHPTQIPPEWHKYQRELGYYTQHRESWEAARDAALDELRAALRENPGHAAQILEREHIVANQYRKHINTHRGAQNTATEDQQAADGYMAHFERAADFQYAPSGGLDALSAEVTHIKEQLKGVKPGSRDEKRLNAARAAAEQRVADARARIASVRYDAHDAQGHSTHGANLSSEAATRAATALETTRKRAAGLAEVAAILRSEGLLIDDLEEPLADFEARGAQLDIAIRDALNVVGENTRRLPALNNPARRAENMYNIALAKRQIHAQIMSLTREARTLNPYSQAYRDLFHLFGAAMRGRNIAQYLDVQARVEMANNAAGADFNGHRLVAAGPDKSYTEFSSHGNIAYYADGSIAEADPSTGLPVRRNADGTAWRAPAERENYFQENATPTGFARLAHAVRRERGNRQNQPNVMRDPAERTRVNNEWVAAYNRWHENQSDQQTNADVAMAGERTHDRYEDARAQATAAINQNHADQSALAAFGSNHPGAPLPPELAEAQKRVATFNLPAVQTEIADATWWANCTMYFSLRARVGVPGDRINPRIDPDDGVFAQNVTMMGYRGNWKVYSDGSSIAMYIDPATRTPRSMRYDPWGNPI